MRAPGRGPGPAGRAADSPRAGACRIIARDASRREVRVIRFNCPHCGRYYELLPALAGLPLVCKQCGQRFSPPAESTAPAPPPPPKKPAAPPPSAKPAAPPPTPKLPVAEPEHEPINLDLLPKSAAPPPPPWRPAQPRGPEAEPREGPAPGLLPFVADLVAFVVLVVAGLVLGEVLVHKPTGEVLSELASPKFPPIDLLVWAAPAALFALVYLLLFKRGRSLGAWLRREKIPSSK